jgi:AcrR family transcriptional regulator
MEEKTLHDEVKDDIADAYVALLFKKSPEEISIRELAEKAGVSRMSFYRNFESKDAIIDYKLRTALQKIYEGAHFMDLTVREPILLEEFRYIYDNAPFLKMLNDRGLLSILYKWWDYYARKFLDEHDPTANPYEYAFYSGASINVIIRWIEGGLKETPEQMADYFDALIADRLKRGIEESGLAGGKSKFGPVVNKKADK